MVLADVVWWSSVVSDVEGCSTPSSVELAPPVGGGDRFVGEAPRRGEEVVPVFVEEGVVDVVPVADDESREGSEELDGEGVVLEDRHRAAEDRLPMAVAVDAGSRRRQDEAVPEHGPDVLPRVDLVPPSDALLSDVGVVKKTTTAAAASFSRSSTKGGKPSFDGGDDRFSIGPWLEVHVGPPVALCRRRPAENVLRERFLEPGAFALEALGEYPGDAEGNVVEFRVEDPPCVPRDVADEGAGPLAHARGAVVDDGEVLADEPPPQFRLLEEAHQGLHRRPAGALEGPEDRRVEGRPVGRGPQR
mmetsp:Transcript_8718/g.28527  ORF Transcript_8718/g.28527 Transcript_8718/m.28527 type:complete len:303 (+) Transcript_8718:287-1195(+)